MARMRLAAEFQSPSPEQFRSTILHAGEPAVLRSVADHWPLVAASKGGADWMAMIASRATDLSVGVIRAEPEEEEQPRAGQRGGALEEEERRLPELEPPHTRRGDRETRDQEQVRLPGQQEHHPRPHPHHEPAPVGALRQPPVQPRTAGTQALSEP